MREDSLSDKVYTEIRRKILSNQLVPGNRLKEDAWAKKMDVSRVAVREALNRLFGENLLEKGEKGGYFVKSMGIADLREIRQLREVLELGALRIAFKKLTKEHIDELERICDDFTLMVRNGYYGGACEADVKFHETLFDKFSKARRPGIKGETSVGLGMSIIKTIVEWHHGQIWFESKVGVGTTFHIQIPACD